MACSTLPYAAVLARFWLEAAGASVSTLRASERDGKGPPPTALIDECMQLLLTVGRHGAALAVSERRDDCAAAVVARMEQLRESLDDCVDACTRRYAKTFEFVTPAAAAAAPGPAGSVL